MEVKITFYYLKPTGSHSLSTMWFPTEPTVKEEEDPFPFASMAHALGTVIWDHILYLIHQ